MSALLTGLLDAERLADLARNDVLAGIAPPPIERDQEIFEHFTQSKLIEADLGRNRRKSDGSDRREREENLHWQVRNVEDFIGRRS